MRGRSTLILLIVAAAFGGYLYFFESNRFIYDTRRNTDEEL